MKSIQSNLIHRWILTAAHCLDGESDITVYAEMEADDEYKQVIRVPLENQFVHYAYDPKADSNDIGEYFFVAEYEKREFQKEKSE